MRQKIIYEMSKLILNLYKEKIKKSLQHNMSADKKISFIFLKIFKS